MKPSESENTSMESSRPRPPDNRGDDLENAGSGADERPARPLGTQPEVGDTEATLCVCSNCGHVIPKPLGGPCPPCPVCTGNMEAV
jgi:hypothetical protein